jgi:energy-coupling factor transporter transmembrane protein EcfT
MVGLYESLHPMTKLLLPLWLFVGIFFPTGLWLSGLAVSVFTDVAHARGWSVWRYVVTGLMIITAIVVIQT